MNRSLLLFVVPFCSLFILVGLYLALRSLKAVWKARAIERWPSVSGELVEVELLTRYDEGEEVHEVQVRYRYMVEGLEYIGDLLNPAYAPSNNPKHVALFNRLRSANRVAVVYNPDAPREAYLVKGMYGDALIPVLGAFVFVVVGSAFLAVGVLAVDSHSDYSRGIEILEWKATQEDGQRSEDAG